MKIKNKVIMSMCSLAMALSLSACGVTSNDNSSSETVNDTNSVDTAVNDTSDVEWPTGPVTAVLHASAGGDTDFNARTFATYL